MRLHAIVPVKALERAKSRLAGALAPAERRLLVLEMLDGVLGALARSPVARVWVVSGDPAVLAAAASHGATPLPEAAAGLNPALEQARAAALAAGAEAVVVVPADVPLVTPADIAALAGLLAAGADVAVAPDEAGLGTNALAVRAAAGLPFAFGEGSAARHLRAAAAAGLACEIYRSPGLALDVDDAPSLARYRARAEGPACRAIG